MRRRTRHFSHEHELLLLGHLKRCRFTSTEALGAADTNAVLRPSLGKLLRDIDSLAALLPQDAAAVSAEREPGSLLETVGAMRQACAGASGCVQPFGDLYRAIDVVRMNHWVPYWDRPWYSAAAH